MKEWKKAETPSFSRALLYIMRVARFQRENGWATDIRELKE